MAPCRPHEQPASLPAWRIVTLADQLNRFVEDLPSGEDPVLSDDHFAEWGQRYLESDPDSKLREPIGVKIPLGPFSDIIGAWHGRLAYDPGKVLAATAIIRGEWDRLLTDEDARGLFEAFSHVRLKRDIKLSKGTHLMHLEAGRRAVWSESLCFLRGDSPTLD